MKEIKDNGLKVRDQIVKGDLGRVGELMDVHWQTKKRLSRGISNPQTDAWYELARRNGDLGGKISGVGSGSFLMPYCEDNKRRLREAMRGARLGELSFRFELEGNRVAFGIVSREQRLAHNQRLLEKPSEAPKRMTLVGNAPLFGLICPWMG